MISDRMYLRIWIIALPVFICLYLIAHPDDANYPVDAISLVQGAVENKVILEVNEASLSPAGYRGNARPNM